MFSSENLSISLILLIPYCIQFLLDPTGFENLSGLLKKFTYLCHPQ